MTLLTIVLVAVFSFIFGYIVSARLHASRLKDLDQMNSKLNNNLLKLRDEKGILEVDRERIIHDLERLLNPNGDNNVIKRLAGEGN